MALVFGSEKGLGVPFASFECFLEGITIEMGGVLRYKGGMRCKYEWEEY